MARNKSLLSLLQDLRAEIGASGNPAHNSSVRESQVRLLQRTQELLWEAHDWPHLRVRRIMRVQNGQRYYDAPDDLVLDRVESIHIRYGDEWCPLDPEISDAHYSSWDSFSDQRSWPAERWQVHEDDTVELWPIPSLDGLVSGEGALRFTGIRSLRPLTKDGDRADLDDRLIVLSAAADYLTSRGDKAAPLKLRAADQRLKSLTANQSKIKQFKLFGVGAPAPQHRAYAPRVHYRDRESS